VVGHNAPFAFIHQGFTLAAQQNFVERLLEIVAIDLRLATARSRQCGLVHQVGQISSRKARGCTSQLLQIHIRGQENTTCMDTQNCLPTVPLWSIYHHLAIKATGTQERRVQDFRTVGGGQDHDGLVRLEAVHLYK
jgi:hypothetical protein